MALAEILVTQDGRAIGWRVRCAGGGDAAGAFRRWALKSWRVFPPGRTAKSEALRGHSFHFARFETDMQR